MFNGDQAGPISINELVGKIMAGALDPKVSIWSAGMSDFSPTLIVPEITAMIPMVPESV